jgi:hypothetical protein
VKRNPATNAFLFAVVVSIVLPFIPIVRGILLPFDYLNTQLHEMFHALAAVITGGSVDKILVFRNSEGLTVTYGGFVPLIYSAGYIGASLFGAFMVRSSIHEKSARKWCQILGIVTLLVNVAWVRGDAIGWPIGIFWGVFLMILAAKLQANEILLVAQFLGVQQCINGFKSLRDLLLLTGARAENTDAALLAKETGIPAAGWALLWTVLGIYGVVMAVIGLNKASSAPKRVN